jgi:hypothetical protein
MHCEWPPAPERPDPPKLSPSQVRALEERIAAQEAARVAHAKLWRYVPPTEFEAYLREYPRPLEARPPLSAGKADYRVWIDPTLGTGLQGVVAQGCGTCYPYEVRRLETLSHLRSVTGV